MSFNVTQCPACESTFNTNSRVLAAAAGRVRCGACLNVFEAVDHFLIQEDDEAALEPGESVFVGNNPQEYFDPSRFLTRSALQEPQQPDIDETDSIAEQFLHEELEQSKTVDDEFFSAVLEELQDRDAIGGDAPIEAAEPDTELAPPMLPEHQAVEEIDEEFEEEMLSAFFAAEDERFVLAEEPGEESTLTPVSSPAAAAEQTHEAAAPEAEREPPGDAVEDTETPAAWLAGEEQALEPDEEQAPPPPSPHPELAQSLAEASPDSSSDEPLADAAVSPAPLSPTPSVGLEISASFTFGHITQPPDKPEASPPRTQAQEDEEALQPEASAAPSEEPHGTVGEQQFLSSVAEDLDEELDSELDSELDRDNETGQDSEASPELPSPDGDETGASSFDVDHADTVEDAGADTLETTGQREHSAQEQESDAEAPEVEEALSDAHDVEPLAATNDVLTTFDDEGDTAAASDEAVTESETLHTEDDSVEAQPERELEADAEVEVEEEAEEIDDSTEAIRARALEAELDDEDALEAIPSENLAALGMMSAPVEFLTGKESRLLRSSLLLLSIVLLGGLLSGQYLWQRMALYSQLPQLRGLYEFACSSLGCELPEYRAIDAIRSENLNVQTHPTFENGLMVNTVIRNTAAFDQPFPILILSFNSAENSVIALREFSADEYLDPGLRSTLTMPPMTPVQIELPIIDPGPLAVNYTLAFRFP